MRNADCGIKTKTFRTPFGWTGVALSEKGVRAVILPRKSRAAVMREAGHEECSNALNKRTERILTTAAKELQRYFSGKTANFDLPLDLSGYTPFQQAVWQACAAIPYGETRSYGWIAKRIGKQKAARAVGQAMGANPVPLLVP